MTSKKDLLLTYKQFTRRMVSHSGNRTPAYDNYYLHFTKGNVMEIVFRQRRAYMAKFIKEYPELDKKACDKVEKALADKSKYREKAMKIAEKEMYEVYKILISYGATNHELGVWTPAVEAESNALKEKDRLAREIK